MNHRLTLLLAALVAMIASLPATAVAAPRCDAKTAALQERLEALHFPGGAVDGCAGPSTRAAVQAFQKANGLSADGVAGPKTRAALDAPAALTPVSARPGLHVEVDLSRQLLLVVRDGAVERVYSVSTGKQGYETPVGTFKIGRKERRSWSVPYKVWLPYASYFVGGVAFHAGTTDVERASHGCVRVPAAFARELYDLLAPGTTVIVTRSGARA
ncbi:lipoprotein-anchoring transpeptidase ErfK/SrfK [Solirubrobacter pauli]|uniref:Lipoprotein-anchoring transpeptidase ErfK/SrfK n=1 Tax=Solirubrobacter pauli TaxID=166793 RepID=A0A660L2H9_9ACTN|nr:L,D-transpeptidase family protein [Solirubrobacter pauli]RKQ87082.1 lipoprotein-anchoring transpeptidase ErfK/SrfK [Solirubrobacter pauli]